MNFPTWENAGMPVLSWASDSSPADTLKSTFRCDRIGNTREKTSPAESGVAETWIFQPWLGSFNWGAREKRQCISRSGKLLTCRNHRLFSTRRIAIALAKERICCRRLRTVRGPEITRGTWRLSSHPRNRDAPLRSPAAHESPSLGKAQSLRNQ
jgi:hypothetical protein